MFYLWRLFSLSQEGKDGKQGKQGKEEDDIQRRWYQKKIQEMQRKMENQVKAAKRGPTGDELEDLKKTLREKDQTIESLRATTEQQRTIMNQSTSEKVRALPSSDVVPVHRLRALKDLHERQLMEQADEHQATVRRLRIEVRAASKALDESRALEEAERLSKSPKRKNKDCIQEENSEATKQKVRL